MNLPVRTENKLQGDDSLSAMFANVFNNKVLDKIMRNGGDKGRVRDGRLFYFMLGSHSFANIFQGISTMSTHNQG